MVKVLPDYEYQPELDCSGEINLSEIFPGSSVTEILEILNVGGDSSQLDWKIESFPDWGTWKFTPKNGNDLRPQDGAFKVEVKIKAPNEKNKTFNGTIIIVNKHDKTDLCSIGVTITTPREKYLEHKPVFNRLFQRFPTILRLLNSIYLKIY
jgi:hypothetical protein